MRPTILRYDGAVPKDPAVDTWLASRPGELGDIARRWFGIIRRCGADVRELMHDGYATACVEDAPFAYVGAFRAHVNVGFFQGSELLDPAGLLQGSGKRMRHVKVVPGSHLDEAALEALIEAAHRDIVVKLRTA